jgi:hypothetical protein
MAKWTAAPDGLSVALLTTEEDAASTQARENKDPSWAYFHVELELLSDNSGTWAAHLGERIGDRMWTILKGGGCWWCENKRDLAAKEKSKVNQSLNTHIH